MQKLKLNEQFTLDKIKLDKPAIQDNHKQGFEITAKGGKAKKNYNTFGISNMNIYGYPELEFANIDENLAIVAGGGIGMLFNSGDDFSYLGLFFQRLFFDFGDVSEEFEDISGEWAGIQLGYSIIGKKYTFGRLVKAYSINFVAGLGYGRLTLDDKKRISGSLVNPKLELDIFLSKHVALSSGIGYKRFNDKSYLTVNTALKLLYNF